ncbi:hypothetical protein DAPPUDRAFT_238520 [Daphnia pulex]|uniref:Uncharacterized protein n=1 Tax=Daphnia pulex TaxID=6669 RepID=E9G6M0_DAPPU|nr:hypothetical protein DAPPUDRAFT_238520 [Daphnia pulex]|eukprot:EFX84968.1 hypothetical protein DAPPUDRAFT_238520 [Daphnia pulex]
MTSHAKKFVPYSVSFTCSRNKSHVPPPILLKRHDTLFLPDSGSSHNIPPTSVPTSHIDFARSPSLAAPENYADGVYIMRHNVFEPKKPFPVRMSEK